MRQLEMSTPGATADGMLRAEARDDRTCTWIDVEGQTPALVVWPTGFTVDDDLVQISAPDGRVVATAGEAVHIAGGLVEGGLAGIPSGCGLTDEEQVFLVAPTA